MFLEDLKETFLLLWSIEMPHDTLVTEIQKDGQCVDRYATSGCIS